MSERRSGGSGDAVMMLIGAALFGLFGFEILISLNFVDTTTQQPILMFQVLKWTLRITAIAFALSAVLVFAGQRRPGEILYCAFGLLSAMAFVAIAIWDFSDARYIIPPHPALLLVFAAWNGYGAWQEFQGLRGEPGA